MAGERDRLASVTLAELYFKQGDLAGAIRVLKEVLVANPGSQKARARLVLLEGLAFRSAGGDLRKERIRKLGQILERVRKERGE